MITVDMSALLRLGKGASPTKPNQSCDLDRTSATNVGNDKHVVPSKPNAGSLALHEALSRRQYSAEFSPVGSFALLEAFSAHRCQLEIQDCPLSKRVKRRHSADGCSTKPTLDLIRDARSTVSPSDKHHPQKDTLYYEAFKYEHGARS